ncbi:MAG: hypothetical protein WDW38_008742 [Sanguina aurantia]
MAVKNVTVDALYHVMQSIENKLGGGEGVEGVYGSITQTGMQKVINCLVNNCKLGSRSVLVDIGAGLGRPLLHALLDPGVAEVFGVEMDSVKVQKAVAFGPQVLRQMDQRGILPLGHRLQPPEIRCASVEQVSSLEPATHAYSFWEGVPASGKEAFGKLFAKSRSLKAVAVVQRAIRKEDPSTYMSELGFGPLLLLKSFPVNMSETPIDSERTKQASAWVSSASQQPHTAPASLRSGGGHPRSPPPQPYDPATLHPANSLLPPPTPPHVLPPLLPPYPTGSSSLDRLHLLQGRPRLHRLHPQGTRRATHHPLPHSFSHHPHPTVSPPQHIHLSAGPTVTVTHTLLPYSNSTSDSNANSNANSMDSTQSGFQMGSQEAVASPPAGAFPHEWLRTSRGEPAPLPSPTDNTTPSPAAAAAAATHPHVSSPEQTAATQGGPQSKPLVQKPITGFTKNSKASAPSVLSRALSQKAGSGQGGGARKVAGMGLHVGGAEAVKGVASAGQTASLKRSAAEMCEDARAEVCAARAVQASSRELRRHKRSMNAGC